MTYLQNKYTRCYYNIIDSAKLRIHSAEYTEKHHIIPECFFILRKRKGPPGWIEGNSRDKDNIVSLTAREHYICHLLLTKMVEGKLKSKMYLALLTMVRTSFNQTRYKITSRSYSSIRKNAAMANSGENNPMWGRIRTDEEKSRIKEGMKRSGFSRPTLTQKHKDNISASKKNKVRPQHVIDAMVAGRKNFTFDNNSGKHWYNNGIRSFLLKECPPDCVTGRLSY